MPDVLLVRESRDGGQLGDQARDGDIAVFVGLCVQRVGIERAERRHHRGEDRHRVRGHRVSVEEPAHVLMDHRVAGEQPLPAGHLVPRRQVAVDQQIRRLGEGAPLPQLLDGNAAVAQDAPLAVEEGDGALRRSGVHERRIERHQSRLPAQVGDVDCPLALGSLYDLKVQQLFLACIHADGLLGHGRSFALDACGQRGLARRWQRVKRRAARAVRPIETAHRSSRAKAPGLFVSTPRAWGGLRSNSAMPS